MLPIQLTLHDLPHTSALEDLLRKKAQKLSHYYQRINSCRIVITLPQKHKHQGKLYSVRIAITVPGKELVANHKLDEDIYVAIRDAFNAVKRQLENYARKQRGEVKSHEAEKRGVIKRMFEEDGYGFIEGSDGIEYYFSMANMTYPSFSQIKKGDTVLFIGMSANEGMQANKITLEKRLDLLYELE